MANWNLTPLADVRYPTALTDAQREDVLTLMLGVSRITEVPDDVLTAVVDRQDGNEDAQAEFGQGAITFAYATWRMLGDTERGLVNVEAWLPMLAEVTETMHGVPLADAGSTITSRLFAALMTTAKDPRGPVTLPDMNVDEFGVAVPAAAIFAGMALQFMAARHPHAPKAKPGMVTLPPKVAALAVDLAHAIDRALAV